MTDIAALNARLATLNLPTQTDESLATTGMTAQRIEHALAQAEQGQGGALVYLQKHLPTADTLTTSTPPRAPTTQPAELPAPISTTTTPAATPARAPATRTAPADRVQCRVYGGKAALCVETDLTRQGEPTLRIEAAAATAPKQYDWGNKIVLQLTREELPQVAATALGLLTQCECKNHGPQNDKGLEIQHQGDKLFVRVFQKGQSVRAIPIGASDGYYLTALCLRQLNKASPGLSNQGVIAALKVGRYAATLRGALSERLIE